MISRLRRLCSFNMRALATVALAAGAFVFLAQVVGRAQSDLPPKSDNPQKFDVVSVKRRKAFTPGPMNQRGNPLVLPGGQFLVTAATLNGLIRRAYGLEKFGATQVTGGPAWLNSDRFDIEAHAAKDFAAAPPEGGLPMDLRAMLQELLRDRFKLKFHWEMQEQPIYVLVKANSDGKLGPNLQPSEGNCIGPYTTDPSKPHCLFRITPGLVNVGGITMPQFGRLMGFFPVINRVVRDETGLAGYYDLALEFIPAFMNDANNVAVANPNGEVGVNIFTALNEQLGLKLENRKGPVDVLVIDHAEQPTDN